MVKRVMQGETPALSTRLQPMLRNLKHGGPRSYTREGFHAIECAHGRCSCMDSVYGGVLRACGPCKHEHFRELCSIWRGANAPGRIALKQRCAELLMAFVYSRERSKPAHERCAPLHLASAAGIPVAEFLSTLEQHESVPPTGKASLIFVAHPCLPVHCLA